jgi:STE24 endopeptidase
VLGMIIGFIHAGVLFFLLSVFLTNHGLYHAFFMTNTPIYAGMLFFGLLYTPIELVLSVIMQMISRKNEYEADRFAASTVKEPENIITALKKLAANNLSDLTPHPFYVFLNYSHPPLLQRIQAIRSVDFKKP